MQTEWILKYLTKPKVCFQPLLLSLPIRGVHWRSGAALADTPQVLLSLPHVPAGSSAKGTALGTLTQKSLHSSTHMAWEVIAKQDPLLREASKHNQKKVNKRGEKKTPTNPTLFCGFIPKKMYLNWTNNKDKVKQVAKRSLDSILMWSLEFIYF